jgi:hypothetical protein
MKHAAGRTMLSIAGLLAFAVMAIAAEVAKEVTLKGEIGCAKCAFSTTKECATAIRVTAGEKKAIYLFDEASHKEHHEEVCQDVKPGSVTGEVSEHDGKQYIKVSKLTYDDAK